MKFKDMKNATGTVECIIMSVEERSNKNNGIYLTLAVSDGETQVNAKKWNEKLETFPYRPGQVILAEVKAEEYKNEMSYIIKNVTESSADPLQFIPAAPIKAEDMFNFLVRTAEKCGVYADITKRILTDNKERILIWSAGKAIHHNVRAGLLYHTYRMTKTAAYLASIYNKEPSMLKNCRNINVELLIAGTILHDIGKLWELDTTEFGNADYTVKGALMGHVFIGAEVIGRYARAAKLADEDIMLLQHLILSHHGRFEYQAVAMPAIPEAMILHYIDCIDAEMYQYEVQEEMLEPGTISAKVYGLEQKVYRPSWKVEQAEKK